MAKNEAKITFNADTSDFNDAIKKAGSTMTQLNSELKLVDAQMANTGTTVEGLEKKESILAQQQEQLAAKTQALVGKYEAAVRIWGENSTEAQKYATQVNNAKIAEEKLKNNVSKLNAELQEARTKMDNAERSARDLADGFDDAAREAKDLDNSIGDIAAGNIIADFAGNAISSLAGLEESTRQYRNEQNKLEAIAQSSDQSLDTLKGTYSDLYAITADETLSSTATANLSAMKLSAENLDKVLTIGTGTWAQFGDSIPLDGLAESLNESSKLGATLTGSVVDAINWCSMSQQEWSDALSGNADAQKAFNAALDEGLTVEDAMNAALAECSTEQERQQLLIDALETGYSDLATAYEENNQAVMDMNRANEEMMDSQSKLAEKIAPLQAMVTTLAADGIGFLADNLEIIAPIAIAAGVAFGILAVALNFGTIVQFLSGAMGVLNAVMALNPAVLVVAGLVLLVTVFVTLWTQCEGFRNFWITLWDDLCATAGTAKDFFIGVGEAFIGKLTDIKNGAAETWNSFTSSVSGAVDSAQAKVTALKDGVAQKFNSIKTGITEKINGAKDAVKSAIDKIKGFFNFSWSLPKLKLPHISISGSFSIIPPSAPRFSISWYAKAMDKAMVLSNPAIFGMMGGKALGAGEAGREVVSGESHLIGLIGNEVRKAMGDNGTERIVEAIETLANRVTVLEVNGRAFATATASDSDAVGGSRQMLVDRGLAR